MVAKAVEKGINQLAICDIHDMPFQDGRFDAAIMVHVLHLVSNWTKVVRETARVTRGAILSVVGRTEGTSIRKAYLEMREEMGFPLDRFEAGEEGLRSIVAPIKVVKVEDFQLETNADEDITYFQRRGSSITWDIADDVHQKIISALEASYGGKTLRKRRLLELALWSPEQLHSVGLK